MFKGMIFAAVLFAATAAAADQEWEVGVIGGVGYTPDMTVKNATTSASIGQKTGLALGVFAGQDMYRYFSGEANYLFRSGDLKVEGAGRSATLAAHTHLITGDILAHLRPVGSRIRPFISIGGGIEVMQGTGQESATQPLGNLAALTATREVMPVGEIGVGVKIQVANHVRVRVQVRDFISDKPNDVIAPVPPATITGLHQDIIGTVALSLTW